MGEGTEAFHPELVSGLKTLVVLNMLEAEKS